MRTLKNKVQDLLEENLYNINDFVHSIFDKSITLDSVGGNIIGFDGKYKTFSAKFKKPIKFRIVKSFLPTKDKIVILHNKKLNLFGYGDNMDEALLMITSEIEYIVKYNTDKKILQEYILETSETILKNDE